MRKWLALLATTPLAFGCTQAARVDDEPEEMVMIDEDDMLGELIDMSSVVGASKESVLDVPEAPTKTVFGKDTRTLVKDTSAVPYSSTVMVRSSFADEPGKYSACTGTMIAPDAVLTAAHCIYNAEEHGGVASYVLLSPGAYVDSKGKQRALPGVGTLRSDDFMFPLAFNDENGFDEKLIAQDYAVIRLPKPVHVVGVRKLAALREPVNTTISMTAYHGDLCATSTRNGCKSDFPLYVSTDVIRALDAGTFEHRIDLIPFASGAGISVGGDSGAIVGVQSAQYDAHNSACRLTEDKLVNIRRWARISP